MPFRGDENTIFRENEFNKDYVGIELNKNINSNKQNVEIMYDTGYNEDGTSVQQGDLKNEFYKALTKKQWIKYHKIFNYLDLHKDFSRLDIMGEKFILTEVINEKEQEKAVFKINNSVKKYNEYIIEEVKKNGYYTGEEIQKFIETMYGEEDILKYDRATHKFNSIAKWKEDNATSYKSDSTNEREGNFSGNSKDNKTRSERNELNNSSFFNGNSKYYDLLNKADNLIYYKDRISRNIIVELVDSNYNEIGKISFNDYNEVVDIFGEKITNEIFSNASKNESYINLKKYKITTPKTANSNRIIDLDDSLIDMLKEYYKEEKNLYEFSKDMFVFGNIKPIPSTTLSRNLDKYIIKSNIKRITLHGFRHSHVSLLVDLGCSSREVADRIGDTVSIVEKTYAHLFPDKKNNTINVLNNLKISR